MDFSFNIIFLLIFHILAAIAVSKDCTARGITKKDSFVILTFFFPLIAGIVYGCKRKKLSNPDDMPENSAHIMSSAKFLSVIAVIMFAVSGIYGTMTMNNSDSMMTYHYDIIKYDRNGDAYFFNQKINYYDREGNVYQISDDHAALINVDTQESFEYLICFIDKDGYVVFLDNDDRLNGRLLDDIYFIDDHMYIYFFDVKWDREGLLYNSYGNRIYLT